MSTEPSVNWQPQAAEPSNSWANGQSWQPTAATQAPPAPQPSQWQPEAQAPQQQWNTTPQQGWQPTGQAAADPSLQGPGAWQQNHQHFDQPKSVDKSALWQLLGGVALFIVGVVVTGVSYMSAEIGESYTLAWGPMLFGAVIGIKGLVRLILMR